MGRTIQPKSNGEDFLPMVSIREKDQYVVGKVMGLGETANGNPYATLELHDLEGSTQKSVSKGVYEEVDVDIKSLVQLVGSTKQLREMIPQLQVGEIVTVKNLGKAKLSRGRTMNQYSMEAN
jgi:hypothetical protein